MRSRLTAIALRLVITLSLVGALAAFPGPARAQGGCPATYTVRRGDTLYSLARRYNTTVPEMMRLNRGRIWNPSVIYAGQVICVPAPATQSRVVIEATYEYDPEEEEVWNLLEGGGYIGRRVVYPLAPVNPIETTDDLADSLPDAVPPPVLLGLEIGTKQYALVAVGDESILTSLAITDVTSLETIFPQDGCPDLQPVSVLGMKSDLGALATLWLESGSEEGLRYPFSVTKTGFFRSVQEALLCHPSHPVAFALFPVGAQAGEYRISLVLTEGGLGPPGRGWQARCSGWTSGWFHRFLRSWYGCPR